MLHQEFLNWAAFEKRYSAHTVAAYKSDIEQFIEFLELQYDSLSIQDVTTDIVKSWTVKLVQDNLKAISINRKLVSINRLYRFLQKAGKIKTNPASLVSAPKKESRLISYLDESSMDKATDNYISNEQVHAFPEFRNYLLIELLYGTGIRVNELINLTHENIYLNEGNIKVMGKRSKERVIPVHHELKDLLKKYLELKSKYLHENSLNESNTLLITNKGKKLYPVIVYRVVKGILSDVTTLNKRSPHVLRHTFATHLLNNGANINAIKELLGHSSLAATQVYTHNTIEKLKIIYKQAHPKAEKE
jgi:integrase/recombinase XerC